MGKLVTCVTKTPPGTKLDHITDIGGSWGTRTVSKAIAEIRLDSKAFFTGTATDGPFLRPLRRATGEFVTTQPNDEDDDNLLSLPACP